MSGKEGRKSATGKGSNDTIDTGRSSESTEERIVNMCRRQWDRDSGGNTLLYSCVRDTRLTTSHAYSKLKKQRVPWRFATQFRTKCVLT
jgi:hypothetical protein